MVSSRVLSRMVRLGRDAVDDRVDMERGVALTVGCVDGAKAVDDTAARVKMRAVREYFMVLFVVAILTIWLRLAATLESQQISWFLLVDLGRDVCEL